MLVVHADWSKHAAKRWMTVIRREPKLGAAAQPSPNRRGLGEGAPGGDHPSNPHPDPLRQGEGADRDGAVWHIAAPEPVGDPANLLARLRARAGGAPIALGIDCPIGLPRAYAARHATDADFPAFLRALPDRPGFLDVAATLAEAGPDRPFYPARGIAGMTRLSHAQALGLPDAAALCRACDRATAERPAGAPVFWTLGANQSGKAAISAWRDLIAPALRGPVPPRLWPFDGTFRTLLAPGQVAIAETYPAEAMRQLDLKVAGSKRRQADRAAYAPGLLAAIERLGAVADRDARAAIQVGFGQDSSGEDRLDCLLGALCVLGVATGHRPDTAPDDVWIKRWEGWVLGQTTMPQDWSKRTHPEGTKIHQVR